ncbi:hypothetical protein M1145_02715 [Patescibacteria group bacterium]|nr:hypothetical protein [Patescibacteria group bacterium]
MNLRAYYYQKYGNEFDVFAHFINTNGLESDFLELFEVSRDYLKDSLDFVLYDYFFSAIDFFYSNSSDIKYDFLFFKKIIDEKFIEFCMSDEGKEIIDETHLYFGGKSIDIFDVIYNSREHFENSDYPSVVTNLEYFKFLDKYSDIKYIKEVKILSMLRTFIDNGGFGGEFFSPFSKDMQKYTDIIINGDFREMDQRVFRSNIEEFRGILEIEDIGVYE